MLYIISVFKYKSCVCTSISLIFTVPNFFPHFFFVGLFSFFLGVFISKSTKFERYFCSRDKLQEEKLHAEKKENEDLKTKLAALSVETEKLKMTPSRDNEVKDLRNTLETNTKKVSQLQEKVDKLTSEKFDSLRQIRELKEEKEKLEESLNNSKRELEKVERNVKDSTELKGENSRLKENLEQVKSRLSDLEGEKQSSEARLRRECEAVSVKLQSVEQELEEQRILSAKRWNKIEDAEDLRQENKLLQSKAEIQKKRTEELEIKV